MANSFSPKQIEIFRREAKKLSRELSITYSAALDRIAQRHDFKNWSLLAKHSNATSAKTGEVSPSKKTLEQALALELRISVSEAEELVDAEPQELTGQSGGMTYGFLFDFRKHASPALADKLLKIRGSLQLEVGPGFFETLSNDSC